MPDGIPFFSGVHCDATLIWPGSTYYDLVFTNGSKIVWNGWGGVYRTDPCGADCYDPGTASMLFSAPSGSGRMSPAPSLPPGTHGLEVWGHVSIFGGKGSTMEGAGGGGTLTVSCPVVDLVADQGHTFVFSCALGDPLRGPLGELWVDFAGLVLNQAGFPIDLPFLYTCGGLPPGLTLPAANTGIPTNGGARLSGTPTVPGAQSFSVTAVACSGHTADTASGCGASVTCTLLVGCSAFAITASAPLPLVAHVGVPLPPVTFSAAITPPMPGTTAAWSASALPPGLSLSSAGVLSGTPTTAGGLSVTLRVTLSPGGCFGERIVGMLVADSCAPPAFVILLESGGTLLQEDAASRLSLEEATSTGLFLCGATIPSTAQLFPPTVSQVAPPPPTPVCASPEPLVTAERTTSRARRPAPITSPVSPEPPAERPQPRPRRRR